MFSLNYLLVLLLALSPFKSAYAGTSLVSCVGPEDAEDGIVYLHGMDTPLPSNQEKRNRALLEVLAQHLSLRVAILRSSSRCPWAPHTLCWYWGQDVSSSVQEIADAGQRCFREGARVSLLGFSNGAFFATALATQCPPSPFASLIAFAGGGGKEGPPSRKCSAPRIVMGILDSPGHIRDALEYVSSNPIARLDVFDGDHNLYRAPLVAAMEKELLSCQPG